MRVNLEEVFGGGLNGHGVGAVDGRSGMHRSRYGGDPGLSGLGAAKKKPKEHAALPDAAPKPTKFSIADWHTYTTILKDLYAGLLSGKYPPDAPLPPQPPGAPTKAQVALVKRQIAAIDGARTRATYLASLKAGPAGSTTPSGDTATTTTPDTTTPGTTTTTTPTDTGGQSAPPSGGSSSPSQTTYVSTPGGAAPAPDSGGGGGSGTVIDPATGQPVAASFMSNKYVWIGAGLFAAWWFFKGRKSK